MGVDREKVTSGLYCCTMLATLEHPYRCKECPYQKNGAPCERFAVMKDALALLKEQEPIMIKTIMINGSGRNGRCQNCLMMLNEMDYPNYCGNCGQAVKWE